MVKADICYSDKSESGLLGLPDNNTIFFAEASAITLALDYYWLMDPDHVQHGVYS